MTQTCIQDDTLCMRCCYNLRGLSANGRCPECGAPINVSLHGDNLAYANPDWIKRVRKGCAGIGSSIFAYFGAGGISSFLADYIGSSMSVTILKGVVIAALVIGILRGIWLLTTRGCRIVESNPFRLLRAIIRFAIITSVITIALTPVCLQMLGTNHTFLMHAISAPVGLVGLAGAVAMCRYVTGLAKTIPESSSQLPRREARKEQRLDDNKPLKIGFIAERARLYAWGLYISWPLVIPSIFGLLSGKTGFTCFLVLGTPGLLGFGVLTFALPTYLDDWLEMHEEIARENWADAETSRRP